MFDMQSIGIRISQMRKDAGLTQMGLADKLNISFQAVSSWERGLTMPDVMKLHELADIFGVTIDDILCNTRGSAMVTAAASNEVPIPLPTMEEVSEIAPLLTAPQTDSLAEKIIEEKGDTMNLREIASVAPFVSSAFLEEIAEKVIGETNNLSAIGPIAPFVSTAYLDKLAGKVVETTGDLSAISSIAPFVSSHYLNSLAQKALAEKGLSALSPILPFIDSKIIETYIKEKYLD